MKNGLKLNRTQKMIKNKSIKIWKNQPTQTNGFSHILTDYNNDNNNDFFNILWLRTKIINWIIRKTPPEKHNNLGGVK